MPKHEEARIDERAHLAVAEAPESADDKDACDATGPYRGARCTEPEGHVGDHQHHADSSRAVWAREG